jgi:transposase
MLTQEEYMDVLALKRQGWTNAEIADELGYHPATISNWIRNGGPPTQRAVAASERVIDDRWAARIAALIAPPSRLLATSVFEAIRAEGFAGSYPSVAREVRRQRGPRFRRAAEVSVPIETAPGEESQFDWSDCSARARDWGLGDELWCFGAVACWSRHLHWWFSTSVDRQHTFEGLVGHFESLGGVPKVARTDRMGALGTSQGRRFRLHPPTIDFARHHGVEIAVCQRGDAKRKGKVERPFRGLEESFLEELAVLGRPASVAELNDRARRWVAERINGRTHGTTGAVPAARLELERRFLAPLPRRRFDTATPGPPGARGPAVHRLGGRALLGPPRLSGPGGGVSGGGRCRRARGALGRSGRRPPPPRPPRLRRRVGPAHRAAAEAAALRRRRPLRLVSDLPAPAAGTPLQLPFGDYDVEPPDLAARYGAEA